MSINEQLEQLVGDVVHASLWDSCDLISTITGLLYRNEHQDFTAFSIRDGHSYMRIKPEHVVIADGGQIVLSTTKPT